MWWVQISGVSSFKSTAFSTVGIFFRKEFPSCALCWVADAYVFIDIRLKKK